MMANLIIKWLTCHTCLPCGRWPCCQCSRHSCCGTCVLWAALNMDRRRMAVAPAPLGHTVPRPTSPPRSGSPPSPGAYHTSMATPLRPVMRGLHPPRHMFLKQPIKSFSVEKFSSRFMTHSRVLFSFLKKNLKCLFFQCNDWFSLGQAFQVSYSVSSLKYTTKPINFSHYNEIKWNRHLRAMRRVIPSRPINPLISQTDLVC